FFQAVDGIRDFHVTGVQTCALPISSTISRCSAGSAAPPRRKSVPPPSTAAAPAPCLRAAGSFRARGSAAPARSSRRAPPAASARAEERRVGIDRGNGILNTLIKKEK